MASSKAVQSFRNAAKDYLFNDRFSDFTIVCEDQEFKVHRCFICAQSKWFERCCSGIFEEGKTNRVHLREEHASVIANMISFMYTFDYNDSTSSDTFKSTSTEHTLPKGSSSSKHLTSPAPSNALQMNAWVYATAEKYEILDLKALALEKFKQHADVTNADDMLGAAWAVYKHISLLETDRQLHDTVRDMWLLGGKELIANIGPEALEDCFASIPKLMGELLTMLIGAFGGGAKTVRQFCKTCNYYELFTTSDVVSKEFVCSKCPSKEARESVRLTGQVAVKKFW
ncbi:hypothetical protein LTR37_005150 [Vermiconidia calcicola]|uniref:Uncharacterized protein n=1 Tax=Vermiconidia calcicola TaxID=1690605 RepID=A0ACC3NJV6_9PEZI|nr:hypothetical protein LTR37_005150 [Vermiconidia calcicola]